MDDGCPFKKKGMWNNCRRYLTVREFLKTVNNHYPLINGKISFMAQRHSEV